MEATPALGSDVEAAALLSAIRTGDQVAFTALVAAHDPDLLRLAMVVTGDPDAAKDAVQETWQRLWSRPPDLRDPARLRSWLLKVAANEARQAGRRTRRGRVLERISAPDRQPTDPGADHGRLDLGPALARLRPEERELLGLRYVVGLTSPEIAEHLGISPEGVRTRLHRLLQRLREDLADV